ncbi:MAG: helix-turn-helix transcriptional regulator [Faecousia sp.]
MELKDKLKELRMSRNLTQAQLASAIYVSRSAVAKWENGLGLPSAESMQALQNFYGVSIEEIATSEPEAVIVVKNRKLRKIGYVLGIIAFLAISALSLHLPFLIQDGSYGFTAEMAAGVFSGSAYIDTGDYRIYYTTFQGDEDEIGHWVILSTFRPVHVHLWGCTVSESDYESDIILHNYEMVGRMYSIKGKNGYYNIVKSIIGNGMRVDLMTLNEVEIGGELYPIEEGFFFITPEPVEFFWVGEEFFRVE